MVFVDPNYPRTSNMIKGFHLGFKSKVNRPKPTVQEYFKAVRDQQVSTDYHLDRLEQGMTPVKKRKTNNHGGGSNNKKDHAVGKNLRCPLYFFFFFVLFQNTFKIDVFVSNLVKNVSSKKNKKDHDFRIF